MRVGNGEIAEMMWVGFGLFGFITWAFVRELETYYNITREHYSNYKNDRLP